MELKKLQEKFSAFKTKYQQSYSPQAWQYIEENFFTSIDSDDTPDILMQIYNELGISIKNGNFYRKHLQLIKDRFPIDGNVVEVASGRIPALIKTDFINRQAELIKMAQEQLNIGKGTITIYEPLLIEMTPKYPNMTLNKQYFNLDTDISSADLVVGVMPCEVTETILESAIANDKDFYVAMCGCVHSPMASMYMFGYDISPEMYQQEVISKAEMLLQKYGDNSSLEITQLEDHPINYPILYNKRHTKTLH